MDTMTVREVLNFTAELKLPREMSAADKAHRAMAVADMLNLTKALDNYVGSALLKGIRCVGAAAVVRVCNQSCLLAWQHQHTAQQWACHTQAKHSGIIFTQEAVDFSSVPHTTP